MEETIPPKVLPILANFEYIFLAHLRSLEENCRQQTSLLISFLKLFNQGK